MTETAEAATRLTGWPGKSPDDRGIAHPALYHMLDVAAVAERLIAAEPFTAAMRDALVMLTALHDLGKISDSFRAMLTTGARQYARHWEMTEVLLYHHDGLLADLLGGTRSQRNRLYASVAGHHGRPPGLADLQDWRLTDAVGADGIADAAQAIRLVAGLWPGASLDGLTGESTQALNWWLPGLVAAADWIGSNTDWLQAGANGCGLSERCARTGGAGGRGGGTVGACGCGRGAV